jgi:hypothetical protein
MRADAGGQGGSGQAMHVGLGAQRQPPPADLERNGTDRQTARRKTDSMADLERNAAQAASARRGGRKGGRKSGRQEPGKSRAEVGQEPEKAATETGAQQEGRLLDYMRSVRGGGGAAAARKLREAEQRLAAPPPKRGRGAARVEGWATEAVAGEMRGGVVAAAAGPLQEDQP